MKRSVTFAIIILLLVPFAACIEPERRPNNEGLDLQRRIDSQQSRIDQGISSGELTSSEVTILQDNLNWIKQRYSKAGADGWISGEEWRQIEGSLDQNSRMINDKRNYPVMSLIPEPYKASPYMTIDDQIANQQHRIDQGIASGELTLKESEVVQDNLNWIKIHYNRLISGRGLTSQDEREIQGYLSQNSDMIYKKKHNPVRRLY